LRSRRTLVLSDAKTSKSEQSTTIRKSALKGLLKIEVLSGAFDFAVEIVADMPTGRWWRFSSPVAK